MSSLAPFFCPRCGGKTEHIRDLYGEYDACINCGHHMDVLIGPPVELKPPYKGGPAYRSHHGRAKTKVKRSRGPSRGGRAL
jgi:hypothetical protein